MTEEEFKTYKEIKISKEFIKVSIIFNFHRGQKVKMNLQMIPLLQKCKSLLVVGEERDFLRTIFIENQGILKEE